MINEIKSQTTFGNNFIHGRYVDINCVPDMIKNIIESTKFKSFDIIIKEIKVM